MAIRTCRECEGTVSTEAAVCPLCGAPEPAEPLAEPIPASYEETRTRGREDLPRMWPLEPV